MKTPARAGFAIFVVVSLCLAGCTGGPADEDSNTMVDPAWTSYMLHPTAMMLEDVRPFTVIDGVTNLSTNLTWGVSRRHEGWNCCEHYLATTEWGWLLNFGGEYPMWSEDRGATWSTYLPSTFTDVHAGHRNPPSADRRGSVRVASCKQPRATSSAWGGSRIHPTAEVTNSTHSSGMVRNRHGHGASTG